MTKNDENLDCHEHVFQRFLPFYGGFLLRDPSRTNRGKKLPQKIDQTSKIIFLKPKTVIFQSVRYFSDPKIKNFVIYGHLSYLFAILSFHKRFPYISTIHFPKTTSAPTSCVTVSRDIPHFALYRKSLRFPQRFLAPTSCVMECRLGPSHPPMTGSKQTQPYIYQDIT